MGSKTGSRSEYPFGFRWLPAPKTGLQTECPHRWQMPHAQNFLWNPDSAQPVRLDANAAGMAEIEYGCHHTRQRRDQDADSHQNADFQFHSLPAPSINPLRHVGPLRKNQTRQSLEQIITSCLIGREYRWISVPMPHPDRIDTGQTRPKKSEDRSQF